MVYIVEGASIQERELIEIAGKIAVVVDKKSPGGFSLCRGNWYLTRKAAEMGQTRGVGRGGEKSPANPAMLVTSGITRWISSAG